jgi:hypothetical protein
MLNSSLYRQKKFPSARMDLLVTYIYSIELKAAQNNLPD